MRNDEDGVFLVLLILLNLAEDAVTTLRVQACGRLVKNQHLGLHCQNAGNRHAALLTAGQLEGRFVHHLLGDIDKGSCLTHPPVNLLLAESHVFGAEGDVLVDGFLKKLIFRVLEHQSHLKADVPQTGCVRPHILSVDIDFAGGGLEQTVEMLDEGGFSGAGVTDDADHLTLFNREVDILNRHFDERGPLGICVCQMLCLDDCHLFSSFLSSCGMSTVAEPLADTVSHDCCPLWVFGDRLLLLLLLLFRRSRADALAAEQGGDCLDALVLGEHILGQVVASL